MGEDANGIGSREHGAALVVGGSGALGRAICQRLAAEFESVFFTYLTNAGCANDLTTELGKTARAGCSPRRP